MTVSDERELPIALRAETEGRFSPSLKAVGDRVRRQRHDQGMSLRDLATRSGLSSSFLSLVERGQCSLSLTSLFAISDALSINPTDLLDASATTDAQPQEHALWRAASADGPPTMTVGEREYFRLPVAFEGQTLDPLYFRIHPTSTISPLAVHGGEEFAYVVRGNLWVRLRDQEFSLAAGDAIHFSSTTPHTVANRTDQAVDAFWVSTHSDLREHGVDFV